MAVMNEQQKQFVREYLIDLNATQAAIRAGYSLNSAEQLGYQLLQKPLVRQSVGRAMAERSRRTGINQDRVLSELAKIAFVNPVDVVKFDDAAVKDGVSREDTACISSIKVKTVPSEDGDIVEREIKLYDKIRALELLGKHLGMFGDKLKIDGQVPVLIVGEDSLDD